MYGFTEEQKQQLQLIIREELKSFFTVTVKYDDIKPGNLPKERISIPSMCFEDGPS